jgi:hypothetical protein
LLLLLVKDRRGDAREIGCQIFSPFPREKAGRADQVGRRSSFRPAPNTREHSSPASRPRTQNPHSTTLTRCFSLQIGAAQKPVYKRRIQSASRNRVTEGESSGTALETKLDFAIHSPHFPSNLPKAHP